MSTCRTLALFLSVTLAACSDDVATVGLVPLDSTSLDTSSLDADTADATTAPDTTTTTAPDSQVADTATTPDTHVEDTASPPDTHVEDTATTPDTHVEDTAVVDTHVEDTTTTPDTHVEDTTTTPDTQVEDVAIVDTHVEDILVEDTLVVGPEPLPPADASQLSAPPYLMWVTTSEVSVRWETKTAVVGRVDFGPDDLLAHSLSEPTARTTHELRLTGLPPAHTNSYRIVYGGGALPIRHFRTAPLDDDTTHPPLRFIVWGDNQNGPSTFGKLTPLMKDFDPDFGLSVGDCVQNGTRAEYRSQLFGPMSGYADQVPYLVAAGNHERYSDPNAALFDEYFSQPGNEHCFGWRYGELFVLFIDTDLELDGAPNQRACIEAALSSPAAQTSTFQAAAFHKPPRVEWWFGGLIAFTNNMKAPWVRDELEPLLESYGVDLVFNGHNHLYAYTPETEGGITWVTTGGGGGMIDTRGLFDIWRVGTWPEIETTIHDFHFLQVTLQGSEATVEAIDLDGDVIHSFDVEAH